MSADKTVEELEECLDEYDGIEISPTEKLVKSILQDVFEDDFNDNDSKNLLVMIKNLRAKKSEASRLQLKLDISNELEIDKKDNTKEIVKKVGSLLMHERQFWATSKKSKIHYYNTDIGIWPDDGEELIAARATEILNDSEESSYTNHIVNEVTSYIRGMNMHSKQILVGPPEIMTLENGRINIETGEFYQDFDPDEHHITAIPVFYDKDAECPKFHTFLEGVLDTEEDMQAIYEILGYCLYEDWPYDIVVLFVGIGANGKGVLQNVIERFLGRDNVVSITLQRLAAGRFDSSHLYGKLANLAGEISSETIRDTARMKDLTGGGRIFGEQKNRDGFFFLNTAKSIFATNKPPQIWDDTDGWWRRFRRFDFPRTFRKGEKGTIPRDKLVDSLSTPEELSGILNQAIKGWHRFRKQGKLTGDRGIVRERIEYIRISDPIKYFCTTFIVKDYKGPMILKDSIYDLYLRFCDVEEKETRVSETFFKHFKRLCGFATEEKIRIPTEENKNRRIRIFKKVKIDLNSLKELGVDLEGIDFRPDPEQLTLEDFFELVQAVQAVRVSPILSSTKLQRTVWGDPGPAGPPGPVESVSESEINGHPKHKESDKHE